MNNRTYSNLPYIHPSISPDDLDNAGSLKSLDNRELYTVEGTQYAGYSLLGEGNFGKVYLAQNTTSREWVAIKVAKPDAVTDATTEEYNLLQKAGLAKGKEGDHTLVMTLISGQELYAFSNNLKTLPKGLTDAELLQIAIGMCETVDDMNMNLGILLRDIKPENFIYNFSTGKILPTDLGLAHEAGANIDGNNPELEIEGDDPVGSPFTMAPETLQKVQYSKKSEAYSVATSIADTFNWLDEKNKFIDITHPQFRRAKSLVIKNREIRIEAWSILDQMRRTNPAERMSLSEAAMQLRALQKKYMEKEKRDLAVGVVNLKEFSALSPDERSTLISSIKDFDRILFIHPDSNLSQNEFIKFKLEVERILKENQSLTRVSSTVLSGLPQNVLLQKACQRQQLESRRGAYRFAFNEVGGDGVKPINVKPLDTEQKRTFKEEMKDPQELRAAADKNVSSRQEELSKLDRSVNERQLNNAKAAHNKEQAMQGIRAHAANKNSSSQQEESSNLEQKEKERLSNAKKAFVNEKIAKLPKDQLHKLRMLREHHSDLNALVDENKILKNSTTFKTIINILNSNKPDPNLINELINKVMAALDKRENTGKIKGLLKGYYNKDQKAFVTLLETINKLNDPRVTPDEYGAKLNLAIKSLKDLSTEKNKRLMGNEENPNIIEKIVSKFRR